MAASQGTAENEHSALLAVALMALVAAFNAVDAVIVRLLSPGVHPFVIGFTRALFGLLVLLPWILRRPQILRSNYRLNHLLRAALKLASLIAFFAAFARAPLADATAIAFTAPVFLIIGAWLLLGEPLRMARALAVIVGFAGVLIVLRPDSPTASTSGMLLALLGAFLTAASQLILKPMSARDPTETLVAWNLILTVPLAALPAALVWSTPNPEQWALLALQGALGALNMSLVTKALSLGEASLIAPFEFLRLPIVAGLAFMLFGQAVPISTWIGGGVIFAATLLMARSTRKR